MGKSVVFNDNDKELIKRIAEYQNAHGIPSFVGAVRKLCQVALEMEKIRY